jgi:hypothetical protein
MFFICMRAPHLHPLVLIGQAQAEKQKARDSERAAGLMVLHGFHCSLVAMESAESIVESNRLESAEAVEITDHPIAAPVLVADLTIAIEPPDSFERFAFLESFVPVVVPPIIIPPASLRHRAVSRTEQRSKRERKRKGKHSFFQSIVFHGFHLLILLFHIVFLSPPPGFILQVRK